MAHDDKMGAFRSQIFLPFLHKKEARAFLGPITDEEREVRKFENFFPVHPKTRAPISRKNVNDLRPSYKTVRIFRFILAASQEYVSWFTKVEKVKGEFWK